MEVIWQPDVDGWGGANIKLEELGHLVVENAHYAFLVTGYGGAHDEAVCHATFVAFVFLITSDTLY